METLSGSWASSVSAQLWCDNLTHWIYETNLVGWGGKRLEHTGLICSSIVQQLSWRNKCTASYSPPPHFCLTLYPTLFFWNTLPVGRTIRSEAFCCHCMKLEAINNGYWEGLGMRLLLQWMQWELSSPSMSPWFLSPRVEQSACCTCHMGFTGWMQSS